MTERQLPVLGFKKGLTGKPRPHKSKEAIDYNAVDYNVTADPSKADDVRKTQVALTTCGIRMGVVRDDGSGYETLREMLEMITPDDHYIQPANTIQEPMT